MAAMLSHKHTFAETPRGLVLAILPVAQTRSLAPSHLAFLQMCAFATACCSKVMQLDLSGYPETAGCVSSRLDLL